VVTLASHGEGQVEPHICCFVTVLGRFFGEEGRVGQFEARPA
jgi:hypothetical protein